MEVTGSALKRGILAAVAACLWTFALVTPAAAQHVNLGLRSQPFSSSDWEADLGNKTFVAAKAFDGDLTTRWNSDRGDDNGSFLGTRWDTPQTINKIIIRQAFDRVRAFRVQQFDAASNNWADAFNAVGDVFNAAKGGDASNPVFTVRLKPPLVTTGIRIVFDEVTAVPSIFEVEIFNIPSGTLQGTVRDEQGNPVAGAIVQAGNDRTFTDASGKYTLTADAGTHNITAGKPGAFRTKLVRNITIAPDASVTLDFALVALAPNLALVATAASSSDWENGETYNAAKANDGNLQTRWNSAAGDDDGAWLELGWNQPQTFTKIVIRQAFDRIRNYSLQRWDTGSADWVDILSNVIVPARGGNPVFSHVFAQPITTTKLRLLVVEADAVPSIFEMEVSNVPTAVIRGVVRDVATGQPVPRARVTSDLGDSTVANEQGVFTLVVEPDDYLIFAQAEGYFPGRGTLVAVKAGETQEIVVTLPATGPNLARLGKPIASSEDPSYPASSITDGDPETHWQTAPDKHAGEWVGVMWEQPTRFTVVQIRGVQTLVQNSFLQVLAEDGKTWVELPDTRYNREFMGPNRDFFFPQGITTTGLRWFVALTWAVDDNPGLSELLVFNSPIPAD